jgi:hypothetical protein
MWAASAPNPACVCRGEGFAGRSKVRQPVLNCSGRVLVIIPNWAPPRTDSAHAARSPLSRTISMSWWLSLRTHSTATNSPRAAESPAVSVKSVRRIRG